MPADSYLNYLKCFCTCCNPSLFTRRFIFEKPKKLEKFMQCKAGDFSVIILGTRTQHVMYRFPFSFLHELLMSFANIV